MNIVHIINTTSTGGAENILLNSVGGFKKYWPESKHYLVVLYSFNGDSRLGQFEEVLHLNTSMKLVLSKTWKIRNFVKKNDIKVIHSHLFDSLIVARMTKTRRQKLLHTYHSIDYSKGALHHSPWRIFMDKITYRNTTVIYVSKSVKEAVQSQIPAQKPHGKVVPNFCTEEFFDCYKPNNREELRLVAVGSLRTAKNYPLLIRSASKVSSKKVFVDIYGEGSLKGELQNQIDILKSPITLKGNQIISSNLLAQYDAFVMTSIIEGMPVALIEAITSGMPSILPYHLPVMKEIADESAYYFSSEEHLIEILSKINKRELVKKATLAKNRSKNYTLRKYVSSMRKLYH